MNLGPTANRVDREVVTLIDPGWFQVYYKSAGGIYGNVFNR